MSDNLVKLNPEIFFEGLAGMCGFEYEPKQDIYVTKMYPLQRLFGYSVVYDVMSLPSGMIIDCEPIVFNYKEKQYLIELWKGQYNVMCGGEIGVYYRDIKSDAKDLFTFWTCVSDKDLLEISYTLIHKPTNSVVFTKNGRTWWSTGFKPGMYSTPSDLMMKNIKIKFPSKRMTKAFLLAMNEMGIVGTRNNKSVTFEFDKPVTKQFWSPIISDLCIQLNKKCVDEFNKNKVERKCTDNSPQTITKIFSKKPQSN